MYIDGLGIRMVRLDSSRGSSPSGGVPMGDSESIVSVYVYDEVPVDVERGLRWVEGGRNGEGDGV